MSEAVITHGSLCHELPGSATLDVMARWEPNARERLQTAAMELFEERGYTQTTVGDISARAGLTERTFFRYFVDKREVLFVRAEALEQGIVAAIARAPRDAAPIDIVGAAFEAAGAELQSRNTLHLLRARHALVMKHPELRERELIKLASLASAVAKALHARGVSEPAASLAAEVGLAVFKVGFERWVGLKRAEALAARLRESMAVLRAVACDAQPKSRPSTRARALEGRGRRAP